MNTIYLLTLCAPVEGVVVHLVAGRAQAHADAELRAFDDVVVDVGVHRLQQGDTGILHVGDNVVLGNERERKGKGREGKERKRHHKKRKHERRNVFKL